MEFQQNDLFNPISPTNTPNSTDFPHHQNGSATFSMSFPPSYGFQVIHKVAPAADCEENIIFIYKQRQYFDLSIRAT